LLETKAATPEVYARNATDVTVGQLGEFVEADPASVVDCVCAEDFYLASYDFVLIKMITHVVEIEGPVLDSVLARRIARAHGWQRTGSRIQERVRALAGKSHQSTDEDVGTFYWAPARGPELPVVFRRSRDDEASRDVDEICMPELVALACEVLAQGAADEDAIVAMARELGLQRLRAATRGRFEYAMKEAAGNQGSLPV